MPGPQPPIHPSRDLALEEAVGVTQIGKAACPRVDRVKVTEGVDHDLG